MSGNFRPDRVGNYPLVDFLDPASDTPWVPFSSGGTLTSDTMVNPLVVELETGLQPSDYATRSFAWSVNMSLAARNMWAIGVALRGEAEFGEGVDYYYRLHCSFSGNFNSAACRLVPFVGRADTASIAAGDGQAVPNPFFFPWTGQESATPYVSLSSSNAFVSTGANWTAFPVLGGVAVVNLDSAAHNLVDVVGSISLARYVADLPVFDPRG